MAEAIASKLDQMIESIEILLMELNAEQTYELQTRGQTSDKTDQVKGWLTQMSAKYKALKRIM